MITANEFKGIIGLLGWDTPTACNKLAIHRQTFYNYGTGVYKVPPKVERILSLELKMAENFKNQRKPDETIQYMLRSV